MRSFPRPASAAQTLLTIVLASLVVLALALALARPGQPAPESAPPAAGVNIAPQHAADTATQIATADWPQVQRDPQRSGYTPETLATTFQVAWTHAFQPEKVYPQTQPIVYSGRVFVGTEMGTLYALDAQTGRPQWTYRASGPILNSAAAADGRVYFASLDGAAYALDVTSGALVWKNQLLWRHGFSTAPLLADNKLLLGGQDGAFYALEPGTGALLWRYPVGAPLLQTAAYNNGRVFFGAMNMVVYALHSADGSLAWQSARLPGLAFKDYWPVVTQGHVVVRAMGAGEIAPGFPFNWYGAASDWDWLTQYGPTVAAGQLTNVPDAMQAQDAVMARYQANPAAFTASLHLLDEETGAETLTVPHFDTQTMNGATAPPCVDREGRLIVPLLFVRSGWGRLDLDRQRIVDILYDHRTLAGAPMTPDTTPAGMGNADENLSVTCAANLILAMHTQEGNANYTGAFLLDQRRWLPLGIGHRNRQLSTNTQGGGSQPASVANGMIYHISWHELVARSTR